MGFSPHGFAGSALGPEQLMLAPTAAGASAAGRVLSCDAGPAGLAVRLTGEIAAEAAHRLDGERVRVTANTQGRLIAFQAVARRLADTAVEAQGITAPLEEHRRASFRAPTRLEATVSLPEGADADRATIPAETVDLSQGGCRVQLPVGDVDRASSQVGEPAEITIELDTARVAASGEVLRVEPETREAVIRFDRVSAEDAGEIERHVLRLLV